MQRSLRHAATLVLLWVLWHAGRLAAWARGPMPAQTPDPEPERDPIDWQWAALQLIYHRVYNLRVAPIEWRFQTVLARTDAGVRHGH